MASLGKTSVLSYPIDKQEKNLVCQSLSGNQAAQYQLYQRYVKAMYHTTIRMVGNAADAEDLVQESFIKVFEKLGTFREQSTLGAWIKRITINTTLNFLRRQNRITIVDLEPGELGMEPIEIYEDPSTANLKKIHQAIKELPEGCRVIFSLFLLEGYKHREIAEILHISESTSKSQYLRAKRLLQKRLKPASEYID